MTNDKESIINNLKSNILRLRNLYEKEKEAKFLLENEKNELSAKLLKKEQENESLETKLNTLKLAKSISGANNDMQDAKVKVNNLVREIDKCIALLNR
jgi:septation ring formation regulator EzrA